jgi:hypothetical protein
VTIPEIQALLAKIDGEIEFDTRRHAYRVNGVPSLGSVTQITDIKSKPQLIGWAGNLAVDGALAAAREWYEGKDPNPATLYRSIELVRRVWDREKKRTGNIGTEAHALIEHESRLMLGLESKAPAVSDDARYVFAGWQEWAQSVGYRPLALETKLCHPVHHYAGKVDVIAAFKDFPLVVCDWKSVAAKALSDPLYAEHQLQNWAYRAALEAHGLPETTGLVVKLPRDSHDKPKAFWVPWDEAGFQAFLGLQKAYLWQKGREK